jgi:hypothetical protein
MLTEQELLNQPIAQLNASPELQAITKQYGYLTLADILKLPKPYDLLQHEGFGMRLLAELTHILADHGFTQYLL